VNFAYKGGIFSVIGLGAGLLGTTLSNGLLATRKRLNPGFQLQASGRPGGRKRTPQRSAALSGLQGGAEGGRAGAAPICLASAPCWKRSIRSPACIRLPSCHAERAPQHPGQQRLLGAANEPVR
jgi:hypothetical protein